MSQVEVDKVIPQSGTTLTIGDSGDTVTIPSGATLAIAGSVSGFTSAGIDDNATSVAITINSSEQVGIGTASPSQLLHVYSTGNDIARIETNQTEGRLSLKDATGEAVLKFRNDYRFTNSTGELARLNSSGNFGIGTTAPGSELHVVADDVSQSWSPYDGTVLTIENNDTDGCVLQTVGRNTATNEIWFGDDDSRNIGRIRYEHSNNVLEFWTNGTEKLCITSTGSVGVNTSSPDAKLEVRDDTNQNTTISASSQLTTSGHYHDFAVASNNADYAVGIRRQVTQSTPSYLNPRMDFFVQNNNTYQSADRGVKMTLLNNGKLGIGTTNPDSPLDILTSGNSGLEVNAGTSSAHRIYLGNTGGTSVVGTLSNHDFGLITNGSERMRITSAGKVLVNTTGEYAGTSAEMTVNDGIDVGTTSSANGGFVSFIGDGVGKIGEVGSKVSGYSTMPNIEFHADNVGGGSQAGHIEFNTKFSGGSRSEAMRIDSSGNVGIGTTSVNGKFNVVHSAVCANLQMSASSGSTALRLERTNSDGEAIFFVRGSTGVGNISLTSSSTAYNTSSDYRLKENVSYDFDATTRLKQLKPARFNFIADADTTVDGFLAHEVSSVVPEAITGTKDAVDADGNPVYQGIDQSKLVPLLVKTIQELEARITTLENT